MTYAPRGRHFEEFTLGEAFTTAARTVTEGAVDFFAGLSGDFNPMHTDEDSARQSAMKVRIAHGMLVLAVATGQANQLGIFEGTTLALLGMDKIRWTAPVRLGDTIHTVLTVRETRASSKPDRGRAGPGRGCAEPGRRDGLPGRVDHPHGAAAPSAVTRSMPSGTC
jgi:3-hydroxybutyryl-CoA dehydratase